MWHKAKTMKLLNENTGKYLYSFEMGKHLREDKKAIIIK